MAEKEPWSLLKALSGFVNWKTWTKAVIFLAMGVLILFEVFTVYRAYFMKTGSNIHKPWIVALPGSTVTSPDMHSEQKVEAAKRPWWRPIPYIYGAATVQTTPQSKGSIKFDDWSPGIEGGVGVRWDLG
jgi:hypothetical protein